MPDGSPLLPEPEKIMCEGCGEPLEEARYATIKYEDGEWHVWHKECAP